MELEVLIKSVTAKLGVLELTRKRIETSLEEASNNNKRDIEKKLRSREGKIDEVHDLVLEIQEAKLLSGETPDAVELWGNEIAERTKVHENTVKAIQTTLETINQEAIEENRRLQIAEEETKLARVIEENRKLEHAKLKVREEFETKVAPSTADERKHQSQLRVKLPDLVIAKFDGSHTDFLRFWNTFTEEIDKTSIPATSKFSYLKELLGAKARSQIEGLPFTTEGYARAKNILQNKYGRTSEIVNAHVQKIMNLPTINGVNTARIHEFFEILVRNVQALDTMGKLESINGYVRIILERLPGIRSELARDYENWQDWRFNEFVESLRKWTERNPVEDRTDRPFKRDRDRDAYGSRNNGYSGNRERIFQTQIADDKNKILQCVYCQSQSHFSSQCNVISKPVDRKTFLAEGKRCFNCTGTKHRANTCKSKRNCMNCDARHHSSICEKSLEKTNEKPRDTFVRKQQPMMMSKESSVVYPAVVVEVMGVKCRAVLDTMAGSSYISAGLLDFIGAKEYRTEEREIEMMFNTIRKNVQIYNLRIHDNNGNYVLSAELTKVDRQELLRLPNPHYENMKERYKHLKSVIMNDNDLKDDLPIHIILGNNEYSRVKTATAPLIGTPGEPVAEYTHLGWTIMSPGQVDDVTSVYLTRNKSVSDDYDKLCRLDVMGIQDSPEGDQKSVYESFKEQLVQCEDGCYETGLIWKPGNVPLPSNKSGSLARLSSLLRKLKRDPALLQSYDEIIKEQLDEGIVERVSQDVKAGENEFYIPHKPVIREHAETTKLRIVYDGSARENEHAPSLNDCLETGPPLQNLIWNIIVRNRFHPIVLTGDLKKAFLQVRIREEDRDALRFHWVKDLQTLEVKVFRFTRALFGLNQSPFLLGGTLEQHLKSFVKKYPEEIKEILLSLYVDDLIKGSFSLQKTVDFKELVTKIFKEAKFTLHKWQSNVPCLEDSTQTSESETTFAKQTFGGDSGTKLLGLLWDKANDTLSVKIPEIADVTETKRGVLKFLAGIYDPIGFICPVTLCGKDVFRETCLVKYSWDEPLKEEIRKNWRDFLKNLPTTATVNRTLVSHQEEITHVDLHSFGDASKVGTAAVVYAVIHQPSGISQGIVAAKARLSKKATIPRLELTASLMAANLLSNTREILENIGKGIEIRKQVGWSDSTTALHWIRGDGKQYKQFVYNHVSKIISKNLSEWRHVPGKENPADIASRGAKFNELTEEWWNGPTWLRNEADWPSDVKTDSTPESQSEAKLIKDVLQVTVTAMPDQLGTLMDKFSYKKAIRITAWLLRFRNNLSKQMEKRGGPLTTEEIKRATIVWIKRTQMEGESHSIFEKHVNQFNLKKNEEGIYLCMGRIQGDYPIYLPTYSTFTEKLVMNAHLATLHGGVGLTMTLIRESYWVPRLRQLTKKTRRRCYGCKRMQVSALNKPPPGNLPIERTVGSRPFEAIGLDYAGPFTYKMSAKREGKAYLILYTCSLTRALHLELLPDQSVKSFIPSLKSMIARRGRPSTIYSDNFSTFVSTSKWLKRVTKSEELHDFLSSNDIQWRFNLSRAPWWGGQFERMVGLVKQSLYKVVGKTMLSWDELSEVLLDVELCLNNRPLSYVEDDIQMPILTPNVMIFGQPNHVPEQDADDISDKDLRKRARFLKDCKAKIWKRWTNEYLRGLRERHDMMHSGKSNKIEIGDVMLIKGDDRNRSKWKLGIVNELIRSRDGVIRGAILRSGRDQIERAVQHLYPIELKCDLHENRVENLELNPGARTFTPKRNAAFVASIRIKDQHEFENCDPIVEN